MKLRTLLLLLLLCCNFTFAYDTAKPWAWWWILGNSMKESDITYQLEYMKKSGMGGVCIIPCYGEKGDEANYIDLISPEFMQKLAYIQKEANRLGLGVDMTMGSGWPFGGPWVSDEYASKHLDKNLNILVKENAIVRRASPGGEGYAVNPFNNKAYKFHVGIFEKAFEKYPNVLRGFFNDSYEYYGVNISENFYDEFKKRRGYDFQPYARAVFSTSENWEEIAKNATSSDKQLSTEECTRVWQDYHETLSDLLYESMLEFTQGAKRMGRLSVNEAHGSVGNLIDLYSIADIPETESFGSSGFEFVRNDPDYRENIFGRPNKIMMKFAESSANLNGKKLVASESCTWVANHFKVSLSQIKPDIDKLFVGGINHIFYHGFPYTPKDKAFPGRLFYASTNFNFNSHFSEFFPSLNRYIYQVQSVMQNSKSGNDTLVYFPIHAFWKESGGRNHILMFDVHKASTWLKKCPSFDSLISELDKKGFAFDFISDKELQKLTVENGELCATGKSYKTIIIPDCKQLPLDTYQQLFKLAKKGAKIVFQNEIPSDVPNFANLQERRAKAKDFAEKFTIFKNVKVGNATILATSFGAKREVFADYKLDYIRKELSDSTAYFIVNFNKEFDFGKLAISADCEQVEYFNPLTQKRGEVAFEKTAYGTTFNLSLKQGESCFIFANKKRNNSLKKITMRADESSTKLVGIWDISFAKWVPSSIKESKLPKPFSTNVLASWTKLGDDIAKIFCGTAVYKTKFSVDDISSQYALTFDEIRDVAKVKINGVYIGEIWSVPYRVEIPSDILKNSNELEVEITNCSFNYMRHLASKNPNWNKGNNLIDISYRPPYTIEKKPLEDSGIIGNVHLVKQK